MNLTFAGFGLRFLFSAVLVFASYNPEGYSYFHWVKTVFPAITEVTLEQLFIGVVLLIGWIIYLRATLRSLGMLGLGLAVAFFGLLLALMFKWGWLSLESSKMFAYIVEVLLAAILAIGMSWSHIRRRLSGQMDTDDIDEK